jgi:hypothetical protein
VLAAAIGAALLVVILLARDRGAESAAVPSPAEPVATDLLSALPSTAAMPPAVAAPAAPPSRTPLTRAETIARLDAARAKLRAEATPCWKARAAKRPAPVPGTPAPPDETLGMMKFHYALVVHGGEAEVQNVEVSETTVSDPELDACLRDAISRARWPTTGPEGLLEVEDLLRIGDLTIPEPPSFPKIR